MISSKDEKEVETHQMPIEKILIDEDEEFFEEIIKLIMFPNEEILVVKNDGVVKEIAKEDGKDHVSLSWKKI